jgi:TetR/AcrR family transcriptional regulator, tetracycline repressor protein
MAGWDPGHSTTYPPVPPPRGRVSGKDPMSESPQRKPTGPPRWIVDDPPDKPARIPLNRRRIVLAALSVVEEHGLSMLTMRRVASDLGVSTMALYNHVTDKAELIDLMVDLIVGEVIEQSADDTGDWVEQLRALTRRNHAVWSDHPGFARVYTDGVTIGPNGLANMERPIALLREAGFSDADAGAAFMMLYHYSIASLLIAPVKAVDPKERDSRSDGTTEDRIRRYFAALEPEDIPNTLGLAPYLMADSFEFGLEVILSGLRDRLEAQAG